MSIKDIPLKEVVSDNAGYCVAGVELNRMRDTQLVSIIKDKSRTPMDRYMAVAFLQYNYYNYRDDREHAKERFGIPMSVWWTH